MFSKNFFYRIKYQINKKATFEVFFRFFLDRLKHPFNSFKKKEKRKEHQKYLETKKTSTDYFSLNAYYWNSIINSHFKEFSYLEIGSWEGNSALYILKNFRTKNVICVDIWDRYNDEYKEHNLKNFENFKSNLSEFKERFSYFKNTSNEFFIKNVEKFDIIYIDGWHEAPQVYKDINNSWDCLNINGIIICDDYFYGDITANHNDDLPANAINKFILNKKNKLKIINVNNTQIFLKKLLN